MRAIDHFQAGQAAVADFSAFQALRDDADHFTAGSQGGIGYHAHQANGTAAVDQANTLFGQVAAQVLGRCPILGIRAGAGAAEHTDRLQGHR